MRYKAIIDHVKLIILLSIKTYLIELSNLIIDTSLINNKESIRRCLKHRLIDARILYLTKPSLLCNPFITVYFQG